MAREHGGRGGGRGAAPLSLGKFNMSLYGVAWKESTSLKIGFASTLQTFPSLRPPDHNSKTSTTDLTPIYFDVTAGREMVQQMYAFA